MHQEEARQIRAIVEKHRTSQGNNLLDVGCGTGGHFPYLAEWYSVEGLDLDKDMLKVAKQRFPKGIFHQGDMVNFQLDKKFGAITCLFSAIGYTKTPENMKSAVKKMSQHLGKGGILVVEPWFAPDKWKVGEPSATFVDKSDLKIARVNISEREGDLSIINFHFLVATKGRVEHFTGLHKLGLFTEQDYLGAFEEAGLKTTFDPTGITGRGLYIGVKPD